MSVKDYEVTELHLGLKGQIIERGETLKVHAVSRHDAATEYLRIIHEFDSARDTVTVEVEGETYDCQVEINPHYAAFKRRNPLATEPG